MSSSSSEASILATALYANTLGVHKHEYSSVVNKNATSGSILTIPASNLSLYSLVTVVAAFSGRDRNSGQCAFFYRKASFKTENGTLSQIGSTRTLCADDDSGLVSNFGASVSIAISGTNAVFTVNSGSVNADWTLFADVMIYGIA